MPGPITVLAPGQVRVWLCRPVRSSDPLNRTLVRLLDDDELGRRAAFVGEPDRELFTTAHALARAAVARVTGCVPHPGSVRARRNRRPAVTGHPDLDLSISHTEGLIAVAVARGARCGVDVEPAEAGPVLPLAALSAAEQRALPADPRRRAEAFCRYWTLKEAISKVSGQGLSLSFADVQLTAWGRPPEIVSGHAAIGPGGSSSRDGWLLRHRVVAGGRWGVGLAVRADDGAAPAEPAWSAPVRTSTGRYRPESAAHHPRTAARASPRSAAADRCTTTGAEQAGAESTIMRGTCPCL